MIKISFLDANTVGDVPNIEVFKKFGTFVAYPFTKPEERIDRLKDTDIVITNKVIIDKTVMDACPRIRLICIAATGMNNVDLDYAKSKNIEVRNVTDYSTESVAQVTVGMILTLANQIGYYDHYVKSGAYIKSELFTHFGPRFNELNGKRAGIIGLGTIGKRVARILGSLGMEIVYYSTTGKNNNNAYTRVELEELLFTSDVVSIHAPLNENTKNLITLPKLKLMKPSAFIFNLGRGGIINEQDLVTAINNGFIAGAGLDVFSSEPVPQNHPVFQIKNPSRIVLAPHIAWASIEARTLLIDKIAGHIKSFLETQKI